MSKKQIIVEKDTGSCPVGKCFQVLGDLCGKEQPFMKHLRQSRLEFLKAAKCLLDARIEHLEKRDDPASRKKAEKIKVE